MIQDVKSTFISEIKKRHWGVSQTHYFDSNGKLCKIEYYPRFDIIKTGEYKTIFETKLSRIGLSIGDKFKIKNTIYIILDKYINTDESIVYTIDENVILENNEEYNDVVLICNSNNAEEDKKYEKIINNRKNHIF